MTASSVRYAVLQGDIDLVKDDEVEIAAREQFPSLVEHRLRDGGVAFEILRVPCEAFAHGAPDDPRLELREELPLAGLPLALDEPHDADQGADQRVVAHPGGLHERPGQQRTDGLGLAVDRFPYGASKRGRGVYPVRRGHDRFGQSPD